MSYISATLRTIAADFLSSPAWFGVQGIIGEPIQVRDDLLSSGCGTCVVPLFLALARAQQEGLTVPAFNRSVLRPDDLNRFMESIVE